MIVNKISGPIKKGTSSVKSSGPTKILPAPTLIATKNPMVQQQKIFIRQVCINYKHFFFSIYVNISE